MSTARKHTNRSTNLIAALLTVALFAWFCLPLYHQVVIDMWSAILRFF